MEKAEPRTESDIVRNSEGSWISKYSDSKAGLDDIKMAVKRLGMSRFELDNEFIAQLSESIIRNGLTRQRVKDATDHVIDTCSYKSFRISDFVGFDKKRRVYTYDEVVDSIPKGLGFPAFDHLWIKGKLFFTRKDDEYRY